MIKNNKIWVVSDTHFGHKDLAKFVRKSYKDVSDMNKRIIDDWNKKINKGDLVVHLGDFAVDITFSEIKDITKQLNGKKVLIPGNHDKPYLEKDRHFFIKAGFSDVEQEADQVVIGKIIFSHVPIKYVPEGYLNIHGHIHEGGLKDLYFEDENRINICMQQKLEPLLITKKMINGDFKALISKDKD